MLTQGDVYQINGFPYILLSLFDNRGTSGFLLASLDYLGTRRHDPLPKKRMQKELDYAGAIFLGYLGTASLTEIVCNVMTPISSIPSVDRWGWGYIFHYSHQPLNPIYLVQSVTSGGHYSLIDLSRPTWEGFIYADVTMRSICGKENIPFAEFVPVGCIKTQYIWPRLRPLLRRRNEDDRNIDD